MYLILKIRNSSLLDLLFIGKQRKRYIQLSAATIIRQSNSVHLRSFHVHSLPSANLQFFLNFIVTRIFRMKIQIFTTFFSSRPQLYQNANSIIGSNYIIHCIPGCQLKHSSQCSGPKPFPHALVTSGIYFKSPVN